MRVGSVCVRVITVHVYGLEPGERRLPECIRPRHTGPTSGLVVWWAISYNSRSHLVFLQGKVNNACYIAQVVNPVVLPFL